MEARGPAEKPRAHGTLGQVARSHALFCEVLIKKTNNFSLFNLLMAKQKRVLLCGMINQFMEISLKNPGFKTSCNLVLRKKYKFKRITSGP